MKFPKEAIWLILLAAILMLLIQKGFGETPQRYHKRVERRLQSAQHRLIDLDRFSFPAAEDSMYVMRADLDMSLCEDGLRNYRRGRITRAQMDRLLKQLDRDMEDYPPQVGRDHTK